MIEPVLHTLGLSTTEQQLYEALVALPSATHAEINALADDADWNEEATADALTRLLDLDLVSPLPDDEPTRYTAVPPFAALDTMLGARAQELFQTRQRILRLNARFYERSDRQPTDPRVEVVRGRDAIARWLADFYDTVRSELVGYDAPPYVGSADYGNIRREDDDRSNVEYRFVYSPDALLLAGRVHDFSVQDDEPKLQIRVGDVPMKMFLADRRVAFMPLDQRRVSDALLVIRDPELLRVMYVLFDEYWNRALPLHSYGHSLGPQAVTLSTASRELLALLASGHNDQAIADQLGLAPRTVSRRIAGLMLDLRASTRFQAAYQAVLRGWIGPLADSDDTSAQTDDTPSQIPARKA